MEPPPVTSALVVDQMAIIVEPDEREAIRSAALMAAELVTKRAESAALAVLASEAIVAMALSSLTSGADLPEELAVEILMAAKNAAAKTLQVAKDDAEETLVLAKEVAKALRENAGRKGKKGR